MKVLMWTALCLLLLTAITVGDLGVGILAVVAVGYAFAEEMGG